MRASRGFLGATEHNNSSVENKSYRWTREYTSYSLALDYFEGAKGIFAFPGTLRKKLVGTIDCINEEQGKKCKFPFSNHGNVYYPFPPHKHHVHLTPPPPHPSK